MAQKKMSMQTPQDLFVHELSDMLSSEQIIANMLEETAGAVQNPQLKQGLQQHLQQTKQQAKNIETIFQQLGTQPHPVVCHAAEGLRQSILTVMQSNPSPEVLDGAVLAGGCKTEHLEIAGYTGLIEKAQAMGQPQIAGLLQENLQQEQQTLQQLEMISQQMTKQMAAMMQGTQMMDQSASAM